MRQFEVRPDRELGQNFLVDSNILGVIAAAAEVSEGDVVLEIGGGLGVLTEDLARRVGAEGHVHVVEVDRRLQEALLDATKPFENVTVHWGDAMRIDLSKLSPTPTKMVANLPYGIAAIVLLRTIEQLDTVGLWVVMVQREVGERLASPPGSGVYGAPSVIAQLACRVRILRAIPRGVFSPIPNVNSVLLGMRRHDRAPSPSLRALVGGAFAHRRKTLARSLALSGQDRGHSRTRLRETITSLGHPPDVRAERLSPQDFANLDEILQQ